jgi:hypothetical protein
LAPDKNSTQLKGNFVSMPIIRDAFTTLEMIKTKAKALWLTALSAHVIKTTRMFFGCGAGRSSLWLG